MPSKFGANSRFRINFSIRIVGSESLKPLTVDGMLPWIGNKTSSCKPLKFFLQTSQVVETFTSVRARVAALPKHLKTRVRRLVRQTDL